MDILSYEGGCSDVFSVGRMLTTLFEIGVYVVEATSSLAAGVAPCAVSGRYRGQRQLL